MDGHAPARTPAQAAASRANGAKSTGPATAIGKTTSAANSVVHGLATQAALLPTETLAIYEANLASWFASIPARSPGERQAVARIADVAFRYERLARMEVRLANANLEMKVAGCETAKKLKLAREALEGLRGLIGMAESVTGPRHVSQVATIRPAILRVARAVDEADVPVGVCAVLDRAVNNLTGDEHVVEVPASVFHELAQAARAAETALVQRIEDLEKALDSDRERLADEALLGDDEKMKMIDRHRGRLAREMATQIEIVKALREIAAPEEIEVGSGSSVPFKVELKALGRAAPK